MRSFLLAACILCLAPFGAAQTVGSFVVSGEGCPGSSLLYERFAPGAFDLGGSSLDWIPNSGAGYIVVRGGTALLPTVGGVNLALTDDDVARNLDLGFTFPYPTGLGATSRIDVSSNGYLYLETGTVVSSRCCDASGPAFASFIDDTPSFAVFGSDLNPAAGGTVWFQRAPNVAWITWENVPQINQTAGSTCQIQLFDDGRISLVYGSTSNSTRSTLVGWSGGGGLFDGGPIDFSATTPIDMGASSGPLTTSASIADLPTTGQAFRIDVANVPSDATAGLLVLGARRRNIPLDLIDMPGCSFLTSANIGVVPIFMTPPTGSVRFAFGTTPGTAGLVIETQAAVIAPSVNSFGLAFSNRGTMTIGDVSPVVVRARGMDSENDDTTSGFWTVINASTEEIVGLRFSWIGSSVPNTNYFDTAQAGMADRFDGGNSMTPLCGGTYRNGSDLTVGLDYATTRPTPCGGVARSGWVGSVPGLNAGNFRTLDFAFTSFTPGKAFEFDVDVDGSGGPSGAAMAGMVVRLTYRNGAVVTGELVATDAITAEVLL